MIPFAPNEVERISCLALHDLVGTAREDQFDEIAALVAGALASPIGLVTVVGLDEMWVRGCVGIDTPQTRREHAVCSHTILQDEPLVVGDLSKDERFAHAPAVAAAPHIRFYAGAPIKTAEGLNLGAVCVIDSKPRDGISPAERDALKRLARLAGFAFDDRRRRTIAKAEAESIQSLVQSALRLSEITPFRADALGNIVSIDPCTPTLAHLTGPTEGITAWINHVHPADIDNLLHLWRWAVARARPFSAEFRIRGPRGEWRWFQGLARPDQTPDGARNWVGTLEDIDRRRQDTDRIARLEAERGHLSRVSAMETMASTLAHELNQPLTAISNYVRAAQRMMKQHDLDEPQVAQAMEGAVEAAMRAGGIVRSMRELVSHGELQRRRVEVQPLVREAHRIATIDLPDDELKTEFHLDPAVTTVLADPLQIQQVIINLVRNAVRAVRHVESRRLTICVRPCAKDQCVISVADNGPGIAAEIADRLFTPFASSKGDGMGIGLSISRTIVEAHGGSIVAECSEEGGMLFRFTVPTC